MTVVMLKTLKIKQITGEQKLLAIKQLPEYFLYFCSYLMLSPHQNKKALNPFYHNKIFDSK